jgi:hypothetical protein
LNRLVSRFWLLSVFPKPFGDATSLGNTLA